MIAKGTTHNNGAKLAAYMVTAKPGERAELWQLRGFASDDIRSAFRSVHIITEATHCEQPFFHVQVRNPEHEHLTRAQWERVADRVESKLGLTDQPRAIAFHHDEATGHEHMHVAWSRIDGETLTAQALPFFKLRLKEVSRELETDLGLTPVRSHRDTPVLAPTRDEEEQARRLNVELRDVRQTIREAWERSDSGQSFRAALAEDGLTLAKGEKRDFVVIDREGGMNALGQRILGNSAGEVRARTADLDRSQLPSVEQAREQIVRDRTARPEPEAPMPVKQKQPERETEQLPAPAEIGIAYQHATPAVDLSASLERNGFRLAVVTAADAERSRGANREGEVMIVSPAGEVHQLNHGTTGASQRDVEAFVGQLDRTQLAGIEETQQQINLETRRHIALSQVGLLPSGIQPSAAEEPTDWKRMLTDADYRRELRDRRRIEQSNIEPQREQPRSREPDRR